MNEPATAVLIHDNEYAYCSVAASVLKHLDDMETISWYDNTAQTLLDAQFTGVSLAMVLVDHREDRVCAGRAAAEELTDRVKMPGPFGSLVRDSYDRIARVVSVASSHDHDPDDVHDVYGLKSDAADPFASFFDNVESRPVELS